MYGMRLCNLVSVKLKRAFLFAEAMTGTPANPEEPTS
jgi:hypothetical protein